MTKATFLLLSLSVEVASRPAYRDEIPNGYNIPGVDAAGHTRSSGGGPRNSFGEDFDANGRTWTVALCETDSDGDGLTNGQELGDPDCVWSKGDTPKFTAGITHPGSAEDASAAVDSCSAWTDPGTTTDVELTFPNYAVPGRGTVYGKLAFNVADLFASQQGAAPEVDLFALRFEPIVDSPDVVHHMLLYRCDSEPSSFVGSVSDGGKMPCTDLRYGWAVGGKDFCLPEDVGIRFSKDRADSWHVLEIHYDNPKLENNIKDSSGVRMLVTSTASASQNLDAAAFLWMGARIRDIAIPAGRSAFHISADCVFNDLPDEGVTGFAFGLHGHTLARALWTTVRTKDGTYLHDAGCQSTYDFDLQELLFLPEPFTVTKDMVLSAHCVYDSTGRTTTTRGGDETNDEMCITFLLYYPEQPSIRKCLPSPTVEPSGSGKASDVHTCCPKVDGRATCTEAGTNRSRPPVVMIAHAGLMTLAFGYLMPAGTLVALLRVKMPRRWLALHRGLQTVAAATIAVGAATGVFQSGSHLFYDHHWIGAGLTAAALAQAIGGYLRPHKVGDGETSGRAGRARKIWVWSHRITGALLSIVGFVNLWRGGVLAAYLYPQPRRATRLLLTYLALVVAGGGALAAVAVWAITMRCRCRHGEMGWAPEEPKPSAELKAMVPKPALTTMTDGTAAEAELRSRLPP